MPNVMAVLPNTGGASVQRRKVWPTPITTVSCNNPTKTRNPFKFAGCPKLANRSQPLVGRSSPYCEDMRRRYCCLLTALRAAQTCRYLVYSEANFEFFRPAGATRCTDGCEIWRGGGDLPLLHAKRQISHPSVQRQGCRTPKLKFLLRFDRNLEYKRPAGAYPLHDFHKICRVCTTFQDALGVKIWLDLLKELWGF